jgi:sterol desaturase/sphingolipid hydroxylase (fatty acid hydroxylase superfamily)
MGGSGKVSVNYIVLAIPVFFLLIGLELLVTRLLEKDYYTFSDSIADLSCGTVQQLLELAVKTLIFATYVAAYAHRVISIPSGAAWAWVACFLGVDFLYYWFHRTSHEVNAFWAAHVVHHQSEEYNLSVALRQGALQGWFSWAFYLPLAILGFPPLMFLAVSSINTLYQFWIHTRVIGRLGPLELVFNTPSNHRVHHARNPKYVDRNHGGTLIIWDRLFGTYKAEEEEPVYGITTPLKSWNPLWANVHVWVELGRIARRTRNLGDRFRVFWKRPGWRPDDLGGFVPPPEVDPSDPPPKFRPALPRGLGVYAFAQFVPALLLASWLLREPGSVSPALLAVLGVGVGASLASLGGLLEGRRWAFPAELARMVALPLLLVPRFPVAAAILLGVGLALGAWLFSYRRFFLGPAEAV